MNEDNNVLIIKTVQIQPIRNMITAIKDVLTDATITYTNNGLKIINFDKTHTILVNVILHAEKFELYDCTPEKIIVCANTMHLFKVISTMSNCHTHLADAHMCALVCILYETAAHRLLARGFWLHRSSTSRAFD